MTDQCKNCKYIHNIQDCEDAECFLHENWYSIKVHEQRDKYEAALQRIAEWQKAYPVSIFPEPNWELAHAALKAYGARLDEISASNFRHVLNGIKDIVEEALK